MLLNGSKLWHVDLTPLSKCPKLERLWLQNNELETIDLQPLSACPNIRSLYLEHNKLSGELDLSPLRGCRLLRSLRLKKNQLLGKLDITPLLSCSDLTAFTVDASVTLTASATTEIVPPGIKKHASTIAWVSTDVKRQENQHPKKDVKLHALLIGFRKTSRKDVTRMLEKYGGFTVSVAEKTISNTSALKMFDVFVVELPFPWAILEEIRTHVSATPFVVVARSGEPEPSLCPFKPDKIFIEPMTLQDALDVRDLTRKVIDDDFEILTPLDTSTGAESDNVFCFPMSEVI